MGTVIFMKLTKIVIPLLLVVVLCFSWFTSINSFSKEAILYNDYISEAQESTKDGLYEQAIEFYKKAYEEKPSEGIYNKIKEVYDLYYKEEHTAFVRNCYIADMEAASEAYPKNANYWITVANLYLETDNFSKAYSTVKRAYNYGAVSDSLDQIYEELLYKVTVDYKLYYNCKTALNGYITIFDGNNWMVLDETGNQITSKYNFIGLINDEGKGIYTNDIDSRLLDENEIARARFNVNLEEARCYDEDTGLTPVKIDGKWKYLKENGEFLAGEYEDAGSFYDKKAAVKLNGLWFVIDDNGKPISSKKFEDIKLDLYGRHLQGDVVLAKENGKYGIYNSSMEKVGDFSCDGIDICIDGELIAFKSGDKWGYVDTNGKVAIEPQYVEAKSYSNGMAAVRNDRNQWGFLNSKHKLVIDYEYLDAFYFNSNETCLVTTAENTCQLMSFMFE